MYEILYHRSTLKGLEYINEHKNLLKLFKKIEPLIEENPYEPDICKIRFWKITIHSTIPIYSNYFTSGIFNIESTILMINIINITDMKIIMWLHIINISTVMWFKNYISYVSIRNDFIKVAFVSVIIPIHLCRFFVVNVHFLVVTG